MFPAEIFAQILDLIAPNDVDGVSRTTARMRSADPLEISPKDHLLPFTLVNRSIHREATRLIYRQLNIHLPRTGGGPTIVRGMPWTPMEESVDRTKRQIRLLRLLSCASPNRDDVAHCKPESFVRILTINGTLRFGNERRIMLGYLRLLQRCVQKMGALQRIEMLTHGSWGTPPLYLIRSQSSITEVRFRLITFESEVFNHWWTTDAQEWFAEQANIRRVEIDPIFYPARIERSRFQLSLRPGVLPKLDFVGMSARLVEVFGGDLVAERGIRTLLFSDVWGCTPALATPRMTALARRLRENTPVLKTLILRNLCDPPHIPLFLDSFFRSSRDGEGGSPLCRLSYLHLGFTRALPTYSVNMPFVGISTRSLAELSEALVESLLCGACPCIRRITFTYSAPPLREETRLPHFEERLEAAREPFMRSSSPILQSSACPHLEAVELFSTSLLVPVYTSDGQLSRALHIVEL